MPTAQPKSGDPDRRASSRRAAVGKVPQIKPAQPKPWISEFLRRRDALHKAFEVQGKTLG
jgi:hypothetical protein